MGRFDDPKYHAAASRFDDPSYHAGEEPARSAGQELGRQAGLSVRAGVTGAAGIPTIIGDALNTAVNYGIRGVNAVTGAGIAPLPMMSQAVQSTLTRAGLPEPESRLERQAQDVSAAMSGVGAAAKVGKAAGKAAPRLAQLLTEKLGYQTAGGVAGASAAGTAREEGANPLTQLAAGMMFGTVAPNAAGVAASATKAVGRAALSPATVAGREHIVGSLLRKNATNPERAIRNLDSIPEYVPNSKPTLGPASEDYGLISLERTVRNLNPNVTGQFADRSSANNTARQRHLEKHGGTPDRLARAVERRDEVTTPLRETAFKDAGPVDTADILDNIDLLRSGPTGAREVVGRALSWTRDRVKAAGDDPLRLYEIRKDLRDAVSNQGGKLNKDLPDFGLARSEVGKVISLVDRALESSAPGYKRYLEVYAKRSRGIDSMESLQDLQQRSSLAAPDVTSGYDVLSQAKFKSILNANREQWQKRVGPLQFRAVENIMDDLDRAAALNDPNVRPLGSDTFKNMSTASMIGRALGEPLADPKFQALTSKVQWLYRIPDEKMQQLLVEATLDPKLARLLMEKANPATMARLSVELRHKAVRMGYGAYLGGNE